MTSCPHVPSRHLTEQLSLLARACSGLRLWLGLVDLYPTPTPHLAGLGSSKALQAQGYSRARLNREGPIPSPALYGAWTAFTQHLATGHDLCIPKDPTGLKTAARTFPGAAAMAGSGLASSPSSLSSTFTQDNLSEQETAKKHFRKNKGPRKQKNWLKPA